ncbi:MAG: ferrous iron transport protein A [Chthoniobacterales bacterium]|nr:ferrous iron transport protein A [Chthoniobacterales bacterium]
MVEYHELFMPRPFSSTPLSEAKAGPVLCVERLEGSESVCRRLREVGFCEKAEIRLLSRGGQMICNVCGTRLALSRQLAKKIWVTSSAVEVES